MWVDIDRLDGNKFTRRKYMDYLEDERKKKESTRRGEKRNALDDEIEELKKKKSIWKRMWML